MNRKTTTSTSDGQENESARKPYQSPELVIYGNISEITRGVGNKGMNDSGKGSGKTG